MLFKAAVEGKLTEEWRKANPKVETGAELLKRILAERKKKWKEDYTKKHVGAHGHAPNDDSWRKKYKEPSPTPWTKKLRIYDVRTNKDFTLKTNPLKREDLDEFVKCYNPANRHDRKPTWSEKNPDGRWRAFDYEELVNRDKASLDIFWLKDESLEDSEHLPDPDIIAREIVEDLEAALEQFNLIAEDLGEESA